MTTWHVSTLVAAAGVARIANGGPIVEDQTETPAATLVPVIDVDFWGRREFRSENLDDADEFIYSYGDPVRGKFRIWLDNAPPANLTAPFLDYQDARVYGRDTTPVGSPPPASFVSSYWFSPSLPPSQPMSGPIPPARRTTL